MKKILASIIAGIMLVSASVVSFGAAEVINQSGQDGNNVLLSERGCLS